jgi:hypothetical protein
MSERAVLDALLAADSDARALFDPGEIDHICGLVAESPERVEAGLREFVIEPLERILDLLGRPTELRRAALALREMLETIVRLVGLHPASASEFSGDLRLRWNEFIAAAAASRLYHDAPEARAQKRRAAAYQRPRARSALAEAMLAVMAPEHRKGVSFKDFMASWEQAGVLSGLRLTPDPTSPRYSVEDEDADRGRREYTWGSLAKMYSQSRGKRLAKPSR